MIKLESGVYKLHATAPSINTDDGVKAAADIAADQNTRAYLEAAFFNGHSRTIKHQTFETGGELSLILPTGPYADISYLVTAAGPHTFDNEVIDTEVVYQYPEELQAAYWQTILTTLKVLGELRTSDTERVFAVENCIVTRTSGEKRTSRSIGVPHTQILLLDTAQVEKEHWSIPALSKEQRILKLPIFLSLIRAELSTASDHFSPASFDTLAQQLHAPLGYTFTIENPENSGAVSAQLQAHHQAYTTAAEKAFARLKPSNQDKLIPQPSYRLYLSLEGNTLRVTISPEFISHAGVMEAAGVKLDRSAEHPPRKTAEEIAQISQKLLEELESQTEKV